MFRTGPLSIIRSISTLLASASVVRMKLQFHPDHASRRQQN